MLRDRVLEELAVAGAPLAPREIAERIGCSKAGLTTVLAALASDGLVLLTGATKSRRVHLVEAGVEAAADPSPESAAAPSPAAAHSPAAAPESRPARSPVAIATERQVRRQHRVPRTDRVERRVSADVLRTGDPVTRAELAIAAGAMYPGEVATRTGLTLEEAEAAVDELRRRGAVRVSGLDGELTRVPLSERKAAIA